MNNLPTGEAQEPRSAPSTGTGVLHLLPGKLSVLGSKVISISCRPHSYLPLAVDIFVTLEAGEGTYTITADGTKDDYQMVIQAWSVWLSSIPAIEPAGSPLEAK